jgi:hypothetical protein
MDGIDKLETLQKEGIYVFHGSESMVEEFEPRQAHTIVERKKINDGDPAVFASPFIDYAIFMAIINKTNCPKGYRSGYNKNNGNTKFTATKATLLQLNKNSKGYVHVFNKNDFKERDESEWISYKNVKPLDIIEVLWSDFKPKVEIIPEEKIT